MSSQDVKPPDDGLDPNPVDDKSIITAGIYHRSIAPSSVQSSRRFVSENDAPIKIIGPNNEEILPEDIVVAPDGGWGWLIVFAAFMSNVVVDGTVFSFGILMNPIVESGVGKGKTVDQLRTQVAWVGGMLSGFYMAMGPFVSSMSNMLGFRITAMTGSFVAFFGFLMAWLLNRNGDTDGPNLPSLYGFIGFVGGVGLCLVYVPSIITVGFYFDKKRALATGITVCGSGIGTFVYAPMISFLVGKLHWPVTLLIEGILVLSLTFCIILYRPLKPVKQKIYTGGGDESIREADMPTENTSVIVKVMSVNAMSEVTAVPVPVPDDPNKEEQTKVVKSNSRNQVDLDMATSTRSVRTNALSITLMVDASSLANNANIGNTRTFRVASTKILNKPLHRHDIFYTRSIHPAKSNQTIWDAVPVTGESEQIPPRPKNVLCKCCSYTFPILRKMLDFSLLKSPTFVLLAMSGGISFLGFFVPFAYVSELAVENCSKGGSKLNVGLAAALVAVIGVANTIGRVVIGLIADKVSNQIILINNVALTVAGVGTAFITFFELFPIFIVYACIYGLSVACFISLRSIIVVQLMGISKLTNAFGLLCLFQGIAAFVGGPLAGSFRASSGNYKLSFYVAGAIMTVSGVILYPLSYVAAWERKRLQKKELVRVKV